MQHENTELNGRCILFRKNVLHVKHSFNFSHGSPLYPARGKEIVLQFGQKMRFPSASPHTHKHEHIGIYFLTIKHANGLFNGNNANS